MAVLLEHVHYGGGHEVGRRNPDGDGDRRSGEGGRSPAELVVVAEVVEDAVCTVVRIVGAV